MTDKVGPKKDLNKIIEGTNTTQVQEEKTKEKPSKNMTANERKLKSLYPDMSLAEIERIKKNAATNSTNTLDVIPEKNCKIKMF